MYDEPGPHADPEATSHDPLDPAGGAPGVSCATCQRPIVDAYYDVNDAVTCPECAAQAEAQSRRGTRGTRFLRALAFGGLAALLSAAIYLTVAVVTGYEIGLVALIVGWLVGGAVRFGCHRRGGTFYQGLAVLLAYLAIGTAYATMAVHELGVQRLFDPNAADPNAVDPNAAEERVEEILAPDTLPATRPAGVLGQTDPNAGPGAAAPGELRPVIRAIAVVLVLVFFILALPILASISQPIGFLIIGFALYQAWRLNRRRRLVVLGPFDLSEDAGPSAPPAETS